MTNIKSTFGAGIWAVIATLLILATVEPVDVKPSETQVAVVAGAQANG